MINTTYKFFKNDNYVSLDNETMFKKLSEITANNFWGSFPLKSSFDVNGVTFNCIYALSVPVDVENFSKDEIFCSYSYQASEQDLSGIYPIFVIKVGAKRNKNNDVVFRFIKKDSKFWD